MHSFKVMFSSAFSMGVPTFRSTEQSLQDRRCTLPIYQRASKQARQQEGLLVADTLYQQALKLGDKKAQCLAYIIPLQFYISQKDDSKIEKASTDLKEISRANNYLQYYYHAWSSEIIYFLNQQRSLLALQKAEK